MVPPMTKRRRRQRLILLARRLHLYFGLFLLPWVLLYGVTAIFFNHPGAFHSRSLTHYGADVLDGSLLADPPAAAALAGAVYDQLPEGLSAPENIRWVGRYRLRGGDEHHRFTVYVDAAGQGASVYSTPLPPPSEHPLAALKALTVPVAYSKDSDVSVLAAQLGASGLALSNAPTLLFDVRDGEQRWRIEYDPLDQSAEATLLSARSGLENIRSFLTRLHKLHVYPASASVRWLWSVLVDVLGVAMIVWSMTGLLMWWKLTHLRRAGAVVLGSAATIMLLLATSLFASLGY